jgi:simple sugar transport system permease protein
MTALRRGARRAEPVWDVAFALAGALAIAAVVLRAAGYPPLAVLRGAFGFSLFTAHGITTTLAFATPLIFTGLCFLIGVRAGIFNVGAEGVVMVSAGASVAFGALLALPAPVHLPLTLVVAIAVGVLWMLPSALLKAHRQVHEVLSTIMLNWIAIFLVAFLIAYPLRDRDFPARTVLILPSSRLDPLFPGTSLTVMLAAGILLCLAAYVLLYHTPTGLHLRATGADPAAAHAIGIDVRRLTMLAFLLGGAVAGVAGFTLTAGFPPYWNIDEHMQSLLRMGFLGIVVSAMARNHPLGCVLSAIVVAAVLTSRSYLQLAHGIVYEFAELLAGIVVILLALPGISRDIARWRAKQAARHRALTPSPAGVRGR